MLKDSLPPPLETAEMKATRMWRNNAIMNKIMSKQKIAQSVEQPSAEQPLTTDDASQIIKKLNKLRKEIHKMITHNPTQIINNYIITLQVRKKKLLKEKLRRLEAQQKE